MPGDRFARRFGAWPNRSLASRTLSARRLAKFSHPAIYRYLKGTNRPDAERALRIARVFDADADADADQVLVVMLLRSSPR